MRTTEERLAIIQTRTKERSERKRKRWQRSISVLSVVLCLVVITSASFAMPGLLSSFSSDPYMTLNGAAGIFATSSVLGYILIALLSFILGSFVTVLCIFLHRYGKDDTPDDDRNH